VAAALIDMVSNDSPDPIAVERLERLLNEPDSLEGWMRSGATVRHVRRAWLGRPSKFLRVRDNTDTARARASRCTGAIRTTRRRCNRERRADHLLSRRYANERNPDRRAAGTTTAVPAVATFASSAAIARVIGEPAARAGARVTAVTAWLRGTAIPAFAARGCDQLDLLERHLRIH
jgi:hypothetical protein